MELSNADEAHFGRLLCLETSKVINIFRSKTAGRCTIGRDPTNDIVLDDSKISNFHCILTFRPGFGLVLTNMSRNGSLVNGDMVCLGGSAIVQPGDAISIVSFEFVYHLEVPALPITSIWRKYSSGSKLGSGAFASVYKCLERTTGSWYAIKVVNRKKLQLVQGAELLIKREIEVLKTLNSNYEHIIQLKEVFDEHKFIYFVLEYAGGGDLGEYLHKRPPLSEDLSREFTIQICKGVGFIHEQGVAHRDLKPENILLTTDDPPKLKIADFGLSKLIEAGTILRTQCGTPAYLAPEIVHSFGLGYSNKVDSWSVGVIVFQMLTKQFPFLCESGDHLDLWEFVSQRTMDLRPLLQLTCTEHCIHFVKELLEEDPKKRMPILWTHEHKWLDAGLATTLPVIRQDCDKVIENTGRADSTGAVHDSGQGSLLVPNISGAYPTVIESIGRNDSTETVLGSEGSLSANITGAYPSVIESIGRNDSTETVHGSGQGSLSVPNIPGAYRW